MKAAQITEYSKNINVLVNEVPILEINENQILLKVKAAAVNPLELLILTGSVKLIQDYKMPITLGNECSGIIEKIGKNVTNLNIGDFVYSRLPIDSIGAFAEYVVIDQNAVALMPEGMDFPEAAAIPLTGLTAYQALVDEFEAKEGETLFIAGGSGSFGELAVPIAKELGLNVILSGNSRSEKHFMELGASQYIDYTKEDYWEILSNVDYVIDTIGPSEFDHELTILKQGGILLSLKNTPNKYFAEKNGFSFVKRTLFSLAGAKNDKAAKKSGKDYRFLFVRADGKQLEEITNIVLRRGIKPKIDNRIFGISKVNDALTLVSNGQIDGKVILRF